MIQGLLIALCILSFAAACLGCYLSFIALIFNETRRRELVTLNESFKKSVSSVQLLDQNQKEILQWAGRINKVTVEFRDAIQQLNSNDSALSKILTQVNQTVEVLKKEQMQ